MIRRVPVNALDDDELKRRVANLKYEPMISNNKLKRAAKKLAKREEKCVNIEKY